MTRQAQPQHATLEAISATEKPRAAAPRVLTEPMTVATSATRKPKGVATPATRKPMTVATSATRKPKGVATPATRKPKAVATSATNMPRAAASQIRSQRIATTGLLVALALVLGWVEAFIPLPVSIPGVKLGLANIAVLFALWRYGIGRAALVMAAKVVAAALLFGGFFALAYSACGSLLAFMGMVLLWRFKETFPLLPVSVVAAVLHNIGQIALASAVISSPLVWLNAPVLVIAACVTGAVTGSVATAVMRALPDQGTKPPAGH